MDDMDYICVIIFIEIYSNTTYDIQMLQIKYNIHNMIPSLTEFVHVLSCFIIILIASAAIYWELHEVTLYLLVPSGE